MATLKGYQMDSAIWIPQTSMQFLGDDERLVEDVQVAHEEVGRVEVCVRIELQEEASMDNRAAVRIKIGDDWQSFFHKGLQLQLLVGERVDVKDNFGNVGVESSDFHRRGLHEAFQLRDAIRVVHLLRSVGYELP